MKPDAKGAEDSLILWPASWLDPLPLTDLFRERRPLELELGSGDGSFLAEWATACRETNFLGVERLLGRLRKLDRKGRRAGLTNLRLLRIEAGYFLKYLVPASSVQAMHVYFPDPWPKRKHRKHRLVNEQFPALAARVLVPGGRVYLRTDHEDYFAQMQEVFGLEARFKPVETPAHLLAVPTDFERGFQAMGVSTHHTAYQLLEAAQDGGS